MILASETARALEEALWSAIVELAEAGNDLAVAAQAAPQTQAAAQLCGTADDLASLTRAAGIAARHRARSP